MRDLRSLLECMRFVRRTAVQTAIRLITTGILLARLDPSAIFRDFRLLTSAATRTSSPSPPIVSSYGTGGSGWTA
jgi:hypothetical protein